jgi:MFS family permease
MALPPALRHRPYRLYCIGLLFWQAGVWTQSIAMGWLTYRLTGSVLMLGAVGFATHIPVLLLSPVGGLLADRFDRRRVIMILLWVALAQSATLSLLVGLDIAQPWHLIVLSLVLGVVFAIEHPTRMSFTTRLVDDRRDLPSAVTMNGLIFNLTRMAGPAIGGVMVASFGEAVCFATTVGTYLVTLVIIGRLPLQPEERRATTSLFRGFKDGLDFVWDSPAVRTPMLLAAGVSLVAMPYTVLMPYFAKTVFQGNASVLGILTGAVGFGAICSALYSLRNRTLPTIPRTTGGAVLLMGAALMVFSSIHVLWIAVISVMVAGACSFQVGNGVSTLIQTVVPDHLRGRVIAVFAMSWMGMLPVGSLISGSIAEWIGPERLLMLSAIITIILALWFRRSLPAVESALHARESRA